MAAVPVQRALPRWLTVLLGAAATVVTIAGMRAAASVIAPVFMALVLTIAVHPVLAAARRRGLPQWLAVPLILLVVFAVIVGFIVALGVAFGQLATELPQYSDRFDELLDRLRDALASAGVGPQQVQEALNSIEPGTIIDFVTGLLNGVLGAASSLLFVLATVMFMSVDGTNMPARLDAVPGVAPGLGEALARFTRNTRSYLLVSTVFGLIVAAVDALALVVLDVPLPLLWGLLAFITNYVPNIGFLVGLAPPALLALVVGGPEKALLVVIVYVIANFVLQSVVQPAFVGDAVGLSITVTFLSLVVWTWVLGPLGAVLAIPLSLLVKAVLLDTEPTGGWALTLVSAAPKQRKERRPPAEDSAAPADADLAGGDSLAVPSPISLPEAPAGSAERAPLTRPPTSSG